MLVNPSTKPRGRNVLIVDDDAVTVAVFSRMLEVEGYLLNSADSGENALAQCGFSKPDLIVLDVRLPGMDGFETCRQIQQRFGAESPPIIFVTSSDRPDDVADAFAAGGVDYLTKPVLHREAIARIKTHLLNQLLVNELGESILHRNRLLGMAAHDLRNPLASTLGMAEFLCEGVMGSLTSEQAKAVAMRWKQAPLRQTPSPSCGRIRTPSTWSSRTKRCQG